MGVVYSLMGGVFITYEDEVTLIEFIYDTTPPEGCADLVSFVDTDLTINPLDDPLGEPPLPPSVVVSGDSRSGPIENGVVRFVPVIPFIRGDCNQDGTLTVGDAVCLLGYLFLDTPERLPCGDGTRQDASNIFLVDNNDDGSVNISDAVRVLVHLYDDGPPSAKGSECAPASDCPTVCAP